MKNLSKSEYKRQYRRKPLMRETEREKYRYIDMFDMKHESRC